MTTATAGYPVHVRGRLDPGLSRWLWLVKWLLAIPHYLVLAFLWFGFAVCTVLAFFGILFTGRYPRPLFDFTLGCCAGPGASPTTPTARWPPTSTRPSASARSRTTRRRWTSLTPSTCPEVWCWSSGGCWRSRTTSSWESSSVAAGTRCRGRGSWATGTGGLVGLVALFAGVALLVTGRYPRGLFDFVLGMDRWALRVAAYAGLMTDAYPPFRLDTGGDEPAVTTIDQGPTPPAADGWSGGRIAAAVIGSVLLVLGVGISAAGSLGLWADATQRDADGYLGTGAKSFRGNGYALSFGTVDLRFTEAGWPIGEDWLGDVELRADEDVFLGLGPADDVNRYLAGVEHDEVQGVGPEVVYRHRDGIADVARG